MPASMSGHLVHKRFVWRYFVKKRVWSIAVALAMVLSMICSVFVVSAADEVMQIALSSKNVSKGDVLEATVQMNNYASDWKDLAIRLEYDPSMLELVSVDTSGFGADGSYAEEQKGILETKWSYEEAVVKEETSFDAMKITFKVLDGEGASFLKATLQAGELTAEAEAEFRFEKKLAISQTATLLNAGELPTLKLTPSKNNLLPDDEFTVTLSLENYTGSWAIFAADVAYDESRLEYQSFTKLTGSSDKIWVEVEESDEKLTVMVLSETGANITAPTGGKIDLISLKFKAIMPPAEITATFVDESVAGYDSNGTPTPFSKGTDYTASTSLSLQLDTNQKRPYLTMRLVDTKGNPINDENKLTPGKQVKAIVTLNDFESSWYMMSLSVEYDNTKFILENIANVVAKNVFTNVQAFKAEVEGETTNTVNVSFISNALDNKLQLDGETSADILELTLTVNGAATGTASISTFFKSGGNLTYNSATDEEKELKNELDYIETVDGGTVTAPIGEKPLPYLSIALKDKAEKKTYVRGDTFTAYVRVHDFYQEWSAMSFLLEYNSDVFEIKTNGVSALQFGKEKDKNGEYNDPRVFPVISKLDETSVLSATVFSAFGGDVGLVNEKNNSEITTGEGVVLSVRVRVKTGWEIPVDENGSPITEFPIKARFAPEGNLSGDQILTAGNSYTDNSDSITVVIADNPSPVITRVVGEGEDASKPIKPGETVQFAVSVENFAGSWEAMTLAAEFDSEVFELVQDPGTDSNPNSGSSLVTDSKPFKENADNNNTSSFYPTDLDGYLLASWLNTTDLAMKDTTKQQVLTFTLKAKETVNLTDGAVEEIISVFFVSEGNHAHGKELNEKDYDATPATIKVTISLNDTVYKVQLEWGDMTFTYTYGTWNTNTYVWDNRGWTLANGADNKITVENQGNADVSAELSFTSDDEELSGEFKHNGTAIQSVVVPATETKVITFDLGAYTVAKEAWTGKQELGSITVTIKAVEST